MGGKAWQFFTDPAIEARLRAGEYEVEVVRKHWVAYWQIVLELATALLLIAFFLGSSLSSGWVFFWVAAGLAFHCMWLFACLQSDVFVITNRRVFRVQGPLGRKFATLPAARIVDYSVNQSLVGRMFGYGHFVFESAAQEQALREITFVSEPTRRSDMIQDVVQSAMHRSSSSAESSGQGD